MGWMKRDPSGCEADHSSLYTAEVRNTWIYTSTPKYVFLLWGSIKQGTHLHGFVLS